MVQFLKSGGSSEAKALAKITNIKLSSFGRVCFVLPQKEITRQPSLIKRGVKAINEQDRQLAQAGWNEAQKALKDKKIKLVILDEINLILRYGLLDKKEVEDALRNYRLKKDIVLTGRYCPRDFLALADLATEMKEIKHPYQRGVWQKKGIEF